MSRRSALAPLLVALGLVLFAAACGSDADGTDVVAGDGESAAQPTDEGVEPALGADDGSDDAGDDGPIPVEPDGGIGDGAEPLPGAEEPEVTGTWHGPEVAETNCPGVEWTRVQASAFSFSVPASFSELDVQPIDSEIGVWSGDGIEASFDYGWYSGSIASTPGAENEPVDYDGITGELSIVRSSDPMMIGVLFPEVAVVDEQADRLGMVVNFTDPADEIIGRCIIGSISFD